MPRVHVVGYFSIDHIATPACIRDGVPGGGALYAALGARALGAETVLHAASGSDWPDAWLAQLAALGIDVAQVERRNFRTRRANLLHGTAGSRRSDHYSERSWWERTAALAPPPPRQVAAIDVVVACPMRASDLAATIASAGRAATIADTAEAYAIEEREAILALLARLAIFAPSREETRLLCPEQSDDDAIRALARAGCRVVQKRGADGLALDQGSGTPLMLDAQSPELVDPTGAGDATVGALAAAMAGGSSLVEAARRAIRIGARTVSGLGPAALGFATDD